MALTNLLISRDCTDDDGLLWCEVGDELPKWLSTRLGEQVPYCVGDGCGCEVDDTFLRTEPAVLRIGYEEVVEFSHVGEELFDITANQSLGDLFNGEANLSLA